MPRLSGYDHSGGVSCSDQPTLYRPKRAATGSIRAQSEWGQAQYHLDVGLDAVLAQSAPDSLTTYSQQTSRQSDGQTDRQISSFVIIRRQWRFPAAFAASYDNEQATVWDDRDLPRGRVASVWGDEDLPRGRVASVWDDEDSPRGRVGAVWDDRDSPRGRVGAVWDDRDLPRGRVASVWDDRDLPRGRVGAVWDDRDLPRGRATVDFAQLPRAQHGPCYDTRRLMTTVTEHSGD